MLIGLDWIGLEAFIYVTDWCLQTRQMGFQRLFFIRDTLLITITPIGPDNGPVSHEIAHYINWSEHIRKRVELW